MNALPEAYRLARNITEGMEMLDDDGKTWVRVERMLHVTAPLPVVVWEMANGEEWSTDPGERFKSRRYAGEDGDA